MVQRKLGRRRGVGNLFRLRRNRGDTAEFQTGQKIGALPNHTRSCKIRIRYPKRYRVLDFCDRIERDRIFALQTHRRPKTDPGRKAGAVDNLGRTIVIKARQTPRFLFYRLNIYFSERRNQIRTDMPSPSESLASIKINLPSLRRQAFNTFRISSAEERISALSRRVKRVLVFSRRESCASPSVFATPSSPFSESFRAICVFSPSSLPCPFAFSFSTGKAIFKTTFRSSPDRGR